jgi:hypothetical protein
VEASILMYRPLTGLNLDIEVKGGNGASNFNVLFPADCHGPGGGGGGGLIWFSTPLHLLA